VSTLVKAGFKAKLTYFPGVEPFYLYFNRQRPWLDVPALLMEWRKASEIEEGYLFRAFFASGQLKDSQAITKPALVSLDPTGISAKKSRY
jgi:hypothetical protein